MEDRRVPAMMDPDSISSTTDLSTTSGLSSRTESLLDGASFEEAESSLREAISLNNEEARALLGRIEYQRGNLDAALQAFNEIDLTTAFPKINQALGYKSRSRKWKSRRNTQTSMNAIILLLEAIFLKAKTLQELGFLKDAAHQCKLILETVEATSPYTVPLSLGHDHKFYDIVSSVVEFLPELWRQAGLFNEAVVAYRQALINPWALDSERLARIQKQFAIFLLYEGVEAASPSLGLQTEGAYVPRNNIEEAILLLLILLDKQENKKILWDQTIMDHLSFALSISGNHVALATSMEQIPPGILNRSERWFLLALCYSAGGQDEVALNLLRKIFSSVEQRDHILAALFATKLCGKSMKYTDESMQFAQNAVRNCKHEFEHMIGVANGLLGILLAKKATFSTSDLERDNLQHDALAALEDASELENENSELMYIVGLENAEQRNLGFALECANKYLEMTAGASIKGWKLLALVLSAQKQYADAEMVIDTVLDEMGKWEVGDLLRLKAKLQIAQGKSSQAVETYKLLLALVQAERKITRSGNNLSKNKENEVLEYEAWQDLSYLYIKLGKLSDGNVCLDKANDLKPHSAINWHAKGLWYEAQNSHKEALVAFANALAIDPDHVPSMISISLAIQNLGEKSLPVARSFLTEALRLEPTNHVAWFNLGIIHKMEGYIHKALECFQASFLLQESAPLEAFSVFGCLQRVIG